MALSIRLTANAFISDDTAGECGRAGDIDVDKVLQRIDAFSLHTAGDLTIGTSANVNLPLGSLSTVRGVYLISDRQFNLTFNGGTDVVQIVPAVAPTATSTTTSKARFLAEATLTALNIANPDATNTITVKYIAWGA